MQKLITITVVALFAVLLVGNGTAQAEPYTGCITPGGTIIHVASGDSPLEPCGKNKHLIHFDSEPARQNPDARYNPAALCRALFDLGASTPDLEAMGCPIDPTAAAPGANFYRLLGFSLLTGELGSWDANGDSCHGIVNIKTDVDRWGPGAQWVHTGADQTTGGAYVAKTTQILWEYAVYPDPASVGRQCLQLCMDDPQCIAAYADTPLTHETLLRECRIFHYSDRVKDPWNEVCGANTIQCQSKINNALGYWFVRADDCEGGFTID